MQNNNDYWYRWSDLMNSQKKKLLDMIKAYIQEENWELAKLLLSLENNHEKSHTYKTELLWLQINWWDDYKIKEIEEKRQEIENQQWAILLATQPAYNKIFDIVGDNLSPGLWYNEYLRSIIWFNLIFWERHVYGVEYSREQYWQQAIYSQKKEKKTNKKDTKEKKVRLPKNHILVTSENYKEIGEKIIQNIQENIPYYIKKLELNKEKEEKNNIKRLIERYFLYFFIKSLIDTKVVFDIASKKWTSLLDTTIQHIISYFENILEEKIDIHIDIIKKKLKFNTEEDNIINLSYQYALVDDIEYWENYLNTTYFNNLSTSIDKLRILIMQEYNSQKWQKEATFELLNPLYHIHKEKEELYKKNLEIILYYKKNFPDIDPRIEYIIKDIKKNIADIKELKKKATVFEEDIQAKTSKYVCSLTEIQNKYLRKYQIPRQYWHIFGIIINKINNYYQIKAILLKKADQINEELFSSLKTAY